MNPVFSALVAALLFGAATPFSKILLQGLSPYLLAGILYVGAALGVGILLWLRREGLGVGRNLEARNGKRLGFAILFGGILGPLFLLLGLRIASAGSISLWLVLEMVLTALLGRFFFKDSLGKWGWMGVLGCLAGSLLLSIGEGKAGLQAVGWVALACLCWGLDNHLTAIIDGLKPLQSTFWKGLIAGFVNIALGLSLSGFNLNMVSIVWGLLLGAFAYGASITLYIQSAQSLGATRSQVIFASSPFFGLLLSFLFLKEGITWIQSGAALLFASSLFLLFRDRHGHWHEHAALEHIHSHRHDDGHHHHTHLGQPASLHHSHSHGHDVFAHSHPHWPDIHHRHKHEN